ncbi:hypothetical protein U14_05444 [Candidatus Moduliflexus flocculans]|uniref:Prokaryotic ubiquitin-like protein Pup n=1 Tax=Candidatus Moduliflexus flocculans TaxID=1499966 RepID=A0A081BRY4_9BACT|nr:hypothetical protein U14_05444 [Candidatus Moduliflexus flocculans]
MQHIIFHDNRRQVQHHWHSLVSMTSEEAAEKHVEKSKTPTQPTQKSAQPQKKNAASEKGEKLKKDLDEIIEEIDGVLEENAEEFIKSYVQRGGE